MSSISIKDLEVLATSLLQLHCEQITTVVRKSLKGQQLTADDVGPVYDLLPEWQQTLITDLTFCSHKGFRSITSCIMQDSLDLIFIQVHQVAETQSGDITPEQTVLLEAHAEELVNRIFRIAGQPADGYTDYRAEPSFQQLARLIAEQTFQNMPVNQKRSRLSETIDKWSRNGRRKL